MRNYLWAVGLICTPFLSAADNAMRITEPSSSNAFYVGYEAITDHPECQGPAEAGFRISSYFQNVTYGMHNADGLFHIERGDLEEVPQAKCVRTLRRGVEITQTSVACSPEEMQAYNAISSAPAPTLDLAVELFGCVSPVGQTNLGGTWVATLHKSDTEFPISGDIAAGKEPVQHSDGSWSHVSQTYTRMTRRIFDTREQEWAEESIRSPFSRTSLILRLNDTPAIDVNLRCLPIMLDGLGAKSSYLEIPLRMFVSDTAHDTCTGDGCPIWSDDHRYSRFRSNPANYGWGCFE